MGKKMYIVLVGIILVALGVYVWTYMLHFALYPSSVAIQKVQVTKEQVTVDANLNGSALFFAGYSAEYKDDALYLILRATNFKSLGSYPPAIITIPNTFGTINAIY